MTGNAICVVVRMFALLAMLSTVAANAGPAPLEAEMVHAKWQDYAPRFVEARCWFLGSDAPAPADVRCGTVNVPEDRTDPLSGTISIAVMTIAARRQPAASGALLWIDNGPGNASISARRVESALTGPMAPFRRTLDLVLFDQRGTGYSERDLCRSIPDAFTYGVLVEPEGEQRFKANMRRCLDQASSAGMPIRAYSDWQIALDTRDIRRALGISRWNLFAYLTSTGIAQAIMQSDAAGVRAAVLDSPGANERTRGAEPGDAQAASLMMDRTLRRLSARCRQETGCAAANGNFHSRVLALLDRYERNPLIVDGLDRAAATDGRLVLDDRIAATFLMFMLYRESAHSDLPPVLNALEDRDRRAIRTYANAWFQPPDGRRSQLTRYAIKCRTNAGGMGVSEAAIHRAQREAPEIYRRLGLFRYADDCAAFDFGPPDPSVRETSFDGPVLVAEGALNPVQAMEASRQFTMVLPKGQFVLFSRGGVMPLQETYTGCGGTLIRAFLDDPEAIVDDSCVRELPTVPFLTSYHRASAPGALLSAASQGRYPIAQLAVLGGLAAGFFVVPGLWLRRRMRHSKARYGGSSPDSQQIAPKPEQFAWIAALLVLSAYGSLAIIMVNWATTHVFALPAAVPTSLFASALLAACGGVVAMTALFHVWRQRSLSQSRASLMLLSLVPLFSLVAAVMLVSLL